MVKLRSIEQLDNKAQALYPHSADIKANFIIRELKNKKPLYTHPAPTRYTVLYPLFLRHLVQK